MGATSDHLQELMAQSLPAWRLTGSVHRTDDGAVLVCCGPHEICIEQTPPDLPFRWIVTIDGRRRMSISVIAVLRQVREALDPGYATRRARVAMFPLAPS